MIRGFLFFAALAAPASAHAQARNAETVLMSENERYRADQERFGFSDAVIAGDTIYLSGIVAGRAPGETSLTPAFERVFRQIERILRRAGATLGDIVDVTSFHTDVGRRSWSGSASRFASSPNPASTLRFR